MPAQSRPFSRPEGQHGQRGRRKPAIKPIHGITRRRCRQALRRRLQDRVVSHHHDPFHADGRPPQQGDETARITLVETLFVADFGLAEDGKQNLQRLSGSQCGRAQHEVTCGRMLLEPHRKVGSATSAAIAQGAVVIANGDVRPTGFGMTDEIKCGGHRPATPAAFADTPHNPFTHRG